MKKHRRDTTGDQPPLALTTTAEQHWTTARLQNLAGGKKLSLHPIAHCQLLYTIGLQNADASMTPAQAKKFLQICHILTLIAPSFKALAKAMPGRTLHLLDAGCGNSYLGLALAALARDTHTQQPGALRDWAATPFQLHVTGIDTNADLIARSTARAAALQLSAHMTFHTSTIPLAPLPERLHAVLALHACDTATDEALSLGLQQKADLLAVAPCCHAELSRHFRELSTPDYTGPLGTIVHSPHLRREAAEVFTDTLRLAYIRARGYEATATEFIESTHTPKNRLLLCQRRGLYHEPSRHEHTALKAILNQPLLALERLSGPLSPPPA